MKNSKHLSMLLSFTLLFQGCVVYQKTPSTLPEAARQRNRTKIITANRETFKYAYITLEDGVFYGVRKKSGNGAKTTLRQEEISEIRVKDNRSSTWASFAVATATVLVLGGILYESDITIFGFEVK